MKDSDIYFVKHYVKPYVRKYLTGMFGCRRFRYDDLVDVSTDPLLWRELTSGLVKTDGPECSALPTSQRTCLVFLRITPDVFRRLGWDLTPSSACRLNMLLEQRCKTLLLTYLSAIYCVTGNLSRSIQMFYDRFGYDEEVWPVDSIRKIWYRERFVPKETFFDEITSKISDFIVHRMSHDWDNRNPKTRNNENRHI